MTEQLRIYVAGPYSADTESERLQNTTAAIDAGIRLLQKGHYPFVPHLTHFVEERAREIGVEIEWEDYIEWDVSFLELCDAFLYLGSSRGADLERDHAERLGLVVYQSTEEVPVADADTQQVWRTEADTDQRNSE